MSPRSFLHILCIAIQIFIISSPIYSQNISYLGSTLWSGACDVKIRGNYAYCAFFNGLMILDISNPVSPQYVSQYYTGGEWYNYDRWEGQRLFLSGEYIYYAADYLGLKIININDPLNPVFCSEYIPGVVVSDVYVQDNYAYLVGGNNLIILDVSNPGNPFLVGTGTFDGLCICITVEGNYAYLGAYAGFTGFQIINISDKTNPQVVGSYYIYGTYDVKVIENYAYLTGGAFTILDISDKTNPVFIANWSDPNPPHYVVSSYINGDYAYLTSGGIFSVLNIEDRADPVRLVALQGDWYSGLDVSSHYAYIAGKATGIRVIDISNPNNPIPAGAYEVPREINDVAVSGNYAYVTDFDSGLRIVNAADPTNPFLMGEDTSGYAYCIYVMGNYAFLGAHGVRIVNISNPQNPVFVSYCILPEAAFDIFARGNYVYVADTYAGLYIINVSDPSNPTLVGNYDTPYRATGVYVQGDYAYVADLLSLQIVNISDPANPTFAGSYSSNGGPHKIFVRGSYIYCDDINNGINVMDISNPINPIWLGRVRLAASPWEIQVEDNYVYAPLWASGGGAQRVQIVDVANPTNPTIVGGFRSPGIACGIAVSNNNIYLADTYSLIILHSDITGIYDDKDPLPNSFSLSQNYPNPFNSSTIIDYSIKTENRVTLEVFDILGRKVAILVDEIQAPGQHTCIWEANNQASGSYFYRFRTGNYVKTRSMTVLK